jgi:hypothetical protein
MCFLFKNVRALAIEAFCHVTVVAHHLNNAKRVIFTPQPPIELVAISNFSAVLSTTPIDMIKPKELLPSLSTTDAYSSVSAQHLKSHAKVALPAHRVMARSTRIATAIPARRSPVLVCKANSALLAVRFLNSWAWNIPPLRINTMTDSTKIMPAKAFAGGFIKRLQCEFSFTFCTDFYHNFIILCKFLTVNGRAA